MSRLSKQSTNHILPFSLELGQKLKEDKDGTERRQILDLLEKWKKDFSEICNSKSEKDTALIDVLNLAIEMLQEQASTEPTKENSSTSSH